MVITIMIRVDQQKVIVVLLSLVCCALGIALAPATVGEIAASTGQLSNRLKDTGVWQRLASGQTQSAFVRTIEVVRDVVGQLRNEGRVLLLTPSGILRGRHQINKSGIPGYYYSFRGIKYGQAPVGSRRFRSALPEKPWKGVRNALREGSVCPHRNMLLDTFKGNEDCLFINVYSPELPTASRNPKLPVMFWIHGGAFAFGSGNSFLYGPDFLVAEGVVLVTFNYRLGPLGFLGAGGDASGNAGLKDQVLALKWVQDNIIAFGGDPNSVTIFGESAGGASVHYLMLSPSARGLFHRAISQSGSALLPWAFAEQPKRRAVKLAQVLGFTTNSTKELVEFLRRVPVRKLVDATKRTLTEEDEKKNIGLPFVPSVEAIDNDLYPWEEPNEDLFEEESRFLTERPVDMLARGDVTPVPYITGFNTHEAMLFIRRLKVDPKLLTKLEADFTRVVPDDLNITDRYEASQCANTIRQHYLGHKPVSTENIEDLIKLWTDLMFMRGITASARYHATRTNAPTYVYRFAFDGALGLYKRLLGIQRPGVCHGDELGYMFHFGFFNLSLDPKSPELLTKKRMVTMWTNFAKFGTPTISSRYDNDIAVMWTPNTRNTTDDRLDITYLDITDKLAVRVNPEEDRLHFWDGMVNQYNGRLLH